MKITRDNYETFFLDYFEGKLEEDLIDEFLDFLKQNPDLKEELHLFENIHLTEERVVFSGKKHLYKSVAGEKSAFEVKSVALMEGDLRDEERQSFETYLTNHPELQKEYDLFVQTRLMADPGIKYEHKQNLYKKSGTIILMNWVARAAAVIAILWGIHSLLQPGSQTSRPISTQEIATVKPESIPPKKVESTVKTQETEMVEKLAGKAAVKPPYNQKNTKVLPKTIPAANPTSPERDLTILEEINPILPQLERAPVDNQLADSHSVIRKKNKDTREMETLDEYLASRVKQASDEGLLSANRIFRIGLNVVSDLSGDRIGYKEKNGKISTLDFESKLMAFSIPLQKE